MELLDLALKNMRRWRRARAANRHTDTSEWRYGYDKGFKSGSGYAWAEIVALRFNIDPIDAMRRARL